MTSIPAALYLFPVPMGDAAPAEVLPARNLELLGQVRHFVVENVRSARRFLRRACPDLVIDECTFTELSEHTPAAEAEMMLGPLEQGLPMGVISEAGCPAVADPGADIVAVAQRRGLPVVPLVGPSSIILSLMASGMNGQHFTFLGYLPIEKPRRAAALRDIDRAARSGHTQIFIETPYRNNRLVAELTESLSAGVRLCVASDIGGSRESIVTLTAAQWRKRSYDYSKIPTIFLVSQ